MLIVGAPKCVGCREFERWHEHLQGRLENEFGTQIQLRLIDVRNELHFLRDIEKTPAFVVHERRGNFFWDVDPMLE